MICCDAVLNQYWDYNVFDPEKYREHISKNSNKNKYNDIFFPYEKKRVRNYKDGKITGKQTGWMDGGQKLYEQFMREGLEHGLYTSWNHNGRKSQEMSFNNGVLNGKGTTWYKNGKIETDGVYKDGKINGLWTHWFENGQKKLESNFFAKCSLIDLLTATIPPNELIGSESKAFLKALSMCLSEATPQGLLCLMITQVGSSNSFNKLIAESTSRKLL